MHSQYNLVNKVHQMNCFFRIWKTSTFWCRDPSNKFVPLPLSVQAQLRNIARKTVKRIEMDVLKELDECLTQQKGPKPEERVGIWASMWQLIFMYRELLSAFHAYAERIQEASEEIGKFKCDDSQ